jgi:hypothetical protein
MLFGSEKKYQSPRHTTVQKIINQSREPWLNKALIKIIAHQQAGDNSIK